MSIDWNTLVANAHSTGDEFIPIVRPYLPALGRAGIGVFNGFMCHLLDKDWAAIDSLMYEHMTLTERRDLEDETLQRLRQAAIDRAERIELTKDICFKLALRILMTLAL